ncbi:hypothetical protein OROMI_018316 [Orobanche minor]
MARGSQNASRHKNRDKVKLKKMGSDESDEDYMVDEDEFDDSDDENYSFLANYETEESLGEFEELEKGCVKKKIKNVARSRKKEAAYSEESDDDDYDAKRRKKCKVSHKKKEDSDASVSYREELDNLYDEKSRKRTRASSSEKCIGRCNEKSRKKTIFPYEEETENGDSDDSVEDSDEEFTPDEVDGADDDEELLFMKKNNEVCFRGQEAQIANGKKRKRNGKALRRTKRKKPKKEQVSRKNSRYRGKGFKYEIPVVHRKKTITEKGGKRKLNVYSDPDVVSSGLSDYEYTISEEEREQIKEAGKFCRQLTNSFRPSSSLKMGEEEEPVPSRRKRREIKGKEKVVEIKIEVVKQVCGICLSEEGKRRIRGILDCCSHYFCFACITEWSKVESRCPLCKQRFATITRTARADGGHYLKDAVIPIPERDQVYQPSEEELLNLYENLLCSECHLGGDDEFMLLCDLCDSPAHTYCLGLGHEVPQGNWYCDACRPTALDSPNPESNNNSSSVGTVRETFDLNEVYVPETPLTVRSPSPRYSSGDYFSGLGAFTVYERRQIQLRVQQVRDYMRRHRNESLDSVSGVSLFGSRIMRERLIVPSQQAVRVQVTPQDGDNQGRLPEYTRSARDVFFPNSNSLRGQELHNQDSTSTDYSLGQLSHSELFGISHSQIHPGNSRSNTGTDAGILLNQSREVSLCSIDKEQVQNLVKSHLKSLPGNSDLGYNNFKYIARTSTHTILAAVGLEHRWSEVYPVRVQPLTCTHIGSLPSRETYPVKGQCSSCFNLFVGNVVKEIMLTAT